MSTLTEDAAALHAACAALVTAPRLEAGLAQLFRSSPPGEWVRLRDLYHYAGDAGQSVPPELFAAWLPTPDEQAGTAVVVFLHASSMWSHAARHNVTRLLDKHPAVPKKG
jgi:hypothetical protein